jgi:hypothetical protein
MTHHRRTGITDAPRATVIKLRDVAAEETGLTELPGLVATVEVDWLDGQRPQTLLVSRLEGEPEWIADALFDGSYPVFCNGLGARVSAPRPVVHPAVLAALLDAEQKHDTHLAALSDTGTGWPARLEA